MAFDHAWQTAFASNATAHSISVGLVPLFGIRWSKKIIIAIKTHRINELLAKVRHSAIPRPDYDRVEDLFKLAFFTPTTFPPEWEEWRTIADRYRLDRRHPWPVLAAAVAQFITAEVKSPFELACFEAAGIEQMIASFGEKAALRHLWRAARLQAVKASSADPLFLVTKDVGVITSKRAIKRHRAELHRDPLDSSAASSHLRLPAGFERLGPLARIRAIQTSRKTETRAERFAQDRTQANLLKQVRGSLPVISSALNCYNAFCELRDVRPFPTVEQTIIEWSSVFSDTATYANYISHLQKVWFFVGSPVTWLSPAVRRVAKGLEKCQDHSFKFPNRVQSRLLLRIIRHETVLIEFAQACCLSFLFAFRAPSGTLRLQRAFRNDGILAFTPQAEKALIGIREDSEGTFSVAKFKWRKNLSQGCAQRRPCFCTASLPLANACCLSISSGQPFVPGRLRVPLSSPRPTRAISIVFCAKFSES